MKLRFSQLFTTLFILVLLIFPFITNTVNASILVNSADIQPDIDGSKYTAQNDGDESGVYTNAVNSFNDGGARYILVTQNAQNSGLTSVTYKGSAYTLAKVIVTSDIATLGPNLTPNTTFFFDEGKYNDSNPTAYTRFSVINLSLVGLYKGDNGEPASIITKSPRSGEIGGLAVVNGTIERNIINADSVYMENLIFDAENHDMYPVGQKGSAVPNSRGEFLFYFNAASSNFVMRECIIQNIGASNTEASPFSTITHHKNGAINFYISAGQHNFEDILIRNVKTTAGYGIISSNQANNNFYKNVTINADNSYHPNSFSIKIEHASTANGVAVQDNWAVFSSNLSLPTDMQHNHIYIQDYRYFQVHTPENFRYARYASFNGSSYSSAIRVYQNIIPPVESSSATMDLHDNAWLVRAANSRTVTQQLSDIRTARNAVTPATAKPNPNIKLAADASGQIPSFTTPDYGAPVNITAIAKEDGLFSERTLIPFAADASITLNAANAPTSILYNIDFHDLAKLTLHEAVNGIDPSTISPADPNEGSAIANYPFYSTYQPAAITAARVINATPSTFANDRFTSLVQEIAINNQPSGSLVEGSTTTLTAELTGTNTDSYTWNAYGTSMKGTADDQTINWFSSDSSIASIDQSSGVLTALSEGEVRICAKAMDTNNNGEIEKPWACFTLNVLKATPAPQPTGIGTSTPTPTGTSTPTPTGTIALTNTPTVSGPTITSTNTFSPTKTKQPESIPNSGFPMGKISILPPQAFIPSASNSDITLRIARLSLSLDVVSIPQKEGNWEVSWLSDSQAGYLEGSSFPTLRGNSVLTAHVWNSLNEPGPFHDLKSLKYNDEVQLQAFGHIYTYRVRKNFSIAPDDLKTLFAEKNGSWLTLMTCENFNELTDNYDARRLVQAVLIKID
ncbi:MAG: sortase [Anaerolineaceae bacterium]|nr:sortase [Anaerolineaceae bacterium]